MLVGGGSTAGLVVTLTKAVVTPKMPTQYTLSITNTITDAQAVVVRSDADFKAFREGVSSALEHGHLCDAECPWLYFHVQAAKPHQSLFRSSTHPKQIQANLEQHQILVDLVVQFIKSYKNQCCYRASTLTPQELVMFLFPGMDDDAVSLYMATPMPKVRHSLVKALVIDNCSICAQFMDPEDPSSSALTTLRCGHVFHDHCILETLEKHLACPTCEAARAARCLEVPKQV
ncbi:hypothetical protein LEN26_000780 [Aphanomyces euteiches]|nr:hypothetical protein AeMF1_003673 [Aphanomyces euteiches]KAH9162816.1 hypothetical protein LEN26_000780 [Aphanomyces euteiches]KAH9189267.1 hypothetical protein AeNC1_008754 [Aphanomyces euteiches]